MGRVPKKEAKQESNQEGDTSAAASKISHPLDCPPERWERYLDQPLLPIVKEIKGLGSKKLESLIEKCPKVRDLVEVQKAGWEWLQGLGERLRTRARQSYRRSRNRLTEGVE